MLEPVRVVECVRESSSFKHAILIEMSTSHDCGGCIVDTLNLDTCLYIAGSRMSSRSKYQNYFSDMTLDQQVCLQNIKIKNGMNRNLIIQLGKISKSDKAQQPYQGKGHSLQSKVRISIVCILKITITLYVV